MKKLWSLALITVLACALAFTGCASNPPETEASAEPKPDVKVAWLLCGAEMRDQSNQSIWSGAEKFQSETDCEMKWYSAENSLIAEDVIEQIIRDGYKIIIDNNGALNEKLIEKAKAHPDVVFASLECDMNTDGVSNLISATIRSEESAFLAGYIAANRTTANKVGFISGTDDMSAKPLVAGFKAGVDYAAAELNKEITIQSDFVGNGYNRDGGYELATTMANGGCDIFFVAVAGESGAGVLDALKTLNKPCVTIGNQALIAPDQVLACVTKDNNVTAYEVAMGIYSGNMKGATSYSYGISEGLAGYIKNDAAQKHLGEEMIASLDMISELITKGTIKVPAK